MNFELTQEQEQLVRTVASFLSKRSPISRHRRMRSDRIGYDPALWREMGELGWLSIAYPQHCGGLGGRFLEAALILEEFGRTLVPEPFVPSVVLGGMALLNAANGEQLQRFLAPMLAGQKTLCFAHTERESRYGASPHSLRARKLGQSYRLEGEKIWVQNGHHADVIVVSALSDDGPSLFALPRLTKGVSVQPLQTISGERAACLRFAVELGSEHLLGEAGSALPVIERVLDLGAAAAVAEGLGICQTMLDMTLTYLKTREQFGVKIGAFQALAHRAVDMLAETELLRSIAILSMVKVDDEDAEERGTAVSAAKVQLGTGGKFVSRQAIQLHGGIGMTDEHDIGLYFKRLHALFASFGDEDYHIGGYASRPAFAKDTL